MSVYDKFHSGKLLKNVWTISTARAMLISALCRDSLTMTACKGGWQRGKIYDKFLVNEVDDRLCYLTSVRARVLNKELRSADNGLQRLKQCFGGTPLARPPCFT